MLNILVSLIALIIARSYVVLYGKTRNIRIGGTTDRRKNIARYATCIVFNLVTAYLAPGDADAIFSVFLFLMMLLADTDILIKKIPTELMILLALGLFTVHVWKIKTLPGPAAIVSIIIGSVLYCFRWKIGIASYDILLFVMFGIFVYPLENQLKYAACFLMFWGFAGVITAAADKNERSVPLAPLILLSYMINCGLNRL